MVDMKTLTIGETTFRIVDDTAEKVGAAATAVSQHNTAADSHGDIRLELKAISDRLTAFFDSDDQTLDELSEIVAYITSNKTLIESITTSKVSVSDIINNLTTNVANKPLSAAQGVVLKGLIDTVSNNLSKYALASAIPTKVSQLENDKKYLTEHQDISNLLPRSELPEAVNDALAQAKSSGEFDGPKGDKGDPGYTPQKGVDYWIPEDQEAIVQQVIAALGTPVFGRVDADNNIILTGELVDGTYTVKYEDAEGNVSVIGTLNHTVVPEPTYTNQIPISTDENGNIYNGKGWIENKRLNSSGVVTDTNGYGYTGVTGFIPIAAGDTIRTSANLADPNGSSQQSICFYDSNKTYIARHQYRNDTNKFDYNLFVVNDDKSITFTHNDTYLELGKTAAYVRFCFAGIVDGAIITKNQEIPK